MLSYSNFDSNHFSITFRATTTYGKHTPLIYLWKQSASGLGMNALEYTHEILEPHLIPFVYSLPGDSSEYRTIEYGQKVHTSAYAEVLSWSFRIQRSD
jgi:hypothetical protein